MARVRYVKTRRALQIYEGTQKALKRQCKKAYLPGDLMVRWSQILLGLTMQYSAGQSHVSNFAYENIYLLKAKPVDKNDYI